MSGENFWAIQALPLQVAVHLRNLNKLLELDGLNMRFTNIGDDKSVHMLIGDRLPAREDGRLISQKSWSENLNAKELA
jgi:hypothetical protein